MARKAKKKLKKKPKKKIEEKKNIRLSHKAWLEIRKLKLEYEVSTYVDVFEKLLDRVESKAQLKLELIEKLDEEEKIGWTGEILKSDKTIVVSRDIHARIAEVKVEVMYETERTSRGPGSVSISDVVEVLVQKYV